MGDDSDWAVALDEVWPSRLRVGRGSATVIAGWIYHRHSPVVAVDLVIGQDVRPIVAFGMPRIDVYERRARPDDDPPTATYRSGFWTIVPLPGAGHSEALSCTLRARTASGAELQYALPLAVRAPTSVGEVVRRDPTRVSICMATHDPNLELFRRQIESIRSQTHRNWQCVITDDSSPAEALVAMDRILDGDDRFVLHRESRHLGAYFNFERALARVAPDAALVALADQDDEWHADKVAALVESLSTDHVLAYSDQRLVHADGHVVSDTFWVGRQNQWQDLRGLLLSNTVTGAACMFRRELLSRVLPFPPRLPPMHHDHWIAVVARVAGSITYVNRPLYDYIQHAGQLVGHSAADDRPRVVDPEPDDARERALMLRWQRHYFERVLPTQLMATALLERFRNEVDDDDRATLQDLAVGDRSWAAWRSLLATVPDGRNSATLGYGRDALLGLVWRRLAPLRAARSAQAYADGRHSVWLPSLAVDYGPDAELRAPTRPGP